MKKTNDYKSFVERKKRKKYYWADFLYIKSTSNIE